MPSLGLHPLPATPAPVLLHEHGGGYRSYHLERLVYRVSLAASAASADFAAAAVVVVVAAAAALLSRSFRTHRELACHARDVCL